MELSRSGRDKEPGYSAGNRANKWSSACGDIHNVTRTIVWKYPDQTRTEPTAVRTEKRVVKILQKRAVDRTRIELVGENEEITHAHAKQKYR